MQIFVNDGPIEMKEKATLADVVEQLNINAKGLAVAVNSTVIPYDQWQDYCLKEHDAVMIIRATQGG